MEDGELEFSNEEAFSNTNMPEFPLCSCSTDSFFDELLKDLMLVVILAGQLVHVDAAVDFLSNYFESINAKMAEYFGIMSFRRNTEKSAMEGFKKQKMLRDDLPRLRDFHCYL